MDPPQEKSKKVPSVTLRLSAEPEKKELGDESDSFSDFCDPEDLDEIVSRAHIDRQKRHEKRTSPKSFIVTLKLPKPLLALASQPSASSLASDPSSLAKSAPFLDPQFDRFSHVSLVRDHIVVLDQILSDPSIPEDLSRSLRELHGSLWLQVSTMDTYSLYQLLIQLQKQISRFKDFQGMVKSSDETSIDPVLSLASSSPAYSSPSAMVPKTVAGDSYVQNTSLPTSTVSAAKPKNTRRHKSPVQSTLTGLYRTKRKPVPDADDDLLEESMILSLNDPLSGKKFKTPLRSRYCSHIECFDLDSFMQMNNLEPFGLSVRKKSSKIDVTEILSDTKRRPLNPDQHNKRTTLFQYKAQLRQNKTQKIPNNSLEYFNCPICKLEFSIRVPGDLYIIGDLQEIIEQLDSNSNISKIQIFQDGNWAFVEEQQTKQVTSTEIVELDDLDSSEEEREIQKIKVEKIDSKEVPIPAPVEDFGLTDEDLFGPSDDEIEQEIDRIVDQVISKDDMAKAYRPVNRQINEPVFFTGNGDQEDPFVID
ncbi:hypothetical protein OGAPHI_004288 [Ogataea philodendri]|uniref:SP-RING-type domain-containing protein n=1 Tax=Ogataea philodendri TaxID=1378263 RepID=A0A9P8P6Y8_9ASCO|nr:uncharacterized protein OGAPHI_004288 [Ogataea philodendri]KAH3666099.1 hypothetical protein OGAPHI_004288 [Ogataea philodendri]